MNVALTGICLNRRKDLLISANGKHKKIEFINTYYDFISP